MPRRKTAASIRGDQVGRHNKQLEVEVLGQGLVVVQVLELVGRRAGSVEVGREEEAAVGLEDGWELLMM